jgi:hypothetical protein
VSSCLTPDHLPFGRTHLTHGFSGYTVLSHADTGEPALALLKVQPPSDQGDMTFSLMTEGVIVGEVQLQALPNDDKGPRFRLKHLTHMADYPDAVYKLLKLVEARGVSLDLYPASTSLLLSAGQLGYTMSRSSHPSLGGSRPMVPSRALREAIAATTPIQLVDTRRDTGSPAYVRIPRPRIPGTLPPRRFRVAVIDDFTTPHREGLCTQGTRTMTHGTVVESLLRSLLPNQVEILRMAPKPSQANGRLNSVTALIPLLKDLLNQLKKGVQLDAVNLSTGTVVSYNALSHLCQMLITRQTVHDERSDLLEEIRDNPQLSHLATGLRLLSEIAKRVPTFIGAGNRAYDFNCLLLPKEVHGVGSQDVWGRKSIHTADHGLITTWALGEYPVLPVHEGDRLVGYSLFGDEQVDLPLSQTTVVDPPQPPKETVTIQGKQANLLAGTSLASPTALARYLREPADP